MALKQEIAEIIAQDVEMGLMEGTGHTFDDNWEDFPKDKEVAQKFYLRLAVKIIKKVKDH